jgi:predicted dienelactone hydrolase
MISAFYPAVSANQCSKILAGYMPPAVANIHDQQYRLSNGTFGSLKLSTCKDGAAMAGCIQNLPIAIFSPGLGASRLLYNALAQSIASFGYLVSSIDYVYDENVVEYPDDSHVLGANISTDSQLDLDIKIRAQDVSFVLDELSLASTLWRLSPTIKVCSRRRG